MNAYQIAAFADELEKNAALPRSLKSFIPRAARSIWGHGGGRAIAGGLVGAAGGAATAPPEDRLRRALIGAGIGAAGGYAAPLVTRAGRKKALEGVKHLGRKTKYELTGRGPLPIKPGATQKELDSLRKAEKAGLLSVPTALKGLATKPLQTMKGAWQQAGTMGKVMALGDIAMSAPHIMDKSTQEGTAEKALGSLGTAGGYLLGGRMGLLGSTILGSGLGYLGGKAGKLVGGGKGPTQVPERPAVTYARRNISRVAPEVGSLVRAR